MAIVIVNKLHTNMGAMAIQDQEPPVTGAPAGIGGTLGNAYPGSRK